jgi:hypothetical protein
MEFLMSATISGVSLVPRRIVECLRVVAQVLVVQQPLDRRRPEQRAEAHLRRALADHPDGEDDAVANRATTESVDKGAPDERFDG